MIKRKITPTPQLLKKFYFLEYFYILLKSLQSYTNVEDVFDAFKNLKHQYLLGESKYKKLTIEKDGLTKGQLSKYRYTLEQVLTEAFTYGLISKENQNFKYFLTEKGEEALKAYEKSKFDFYKYLFPLIENNTYGIYHLLKICYENINLKNGLLIFPIYSPLKLGFERKKIKLSRDIFKYSQALTLQLEEDINNFTNKNILLGDAEKRLLAKMKNDNLIDSDEDKPFKEENYNAILSRFRKYWLNYFLNEIYNYEYSYSTFNIVIERAKQFGIIHTTEFFPGFNGRIVYPTAVIVDESKSMDFEFFYQYDEGEKLYIHKPKWDERRNQTEFIDTLFSTYLYFQRIRKTHFINLADIKEKLCFGMRISGFVFDEFLELTYEAVLKGELKIQISLEADKLPYETNAMYLKREPVLVGGKYKNIIAINYRR
jgi:hypothetical protein